MRSVGSPSQSSTSLSQTCLHVGVQPRRSARKRDTALREVRGRLAVAVLAEVLAARLGDAVHPERGLLLVLQRDLVVALRPQVGVVVADLAVLLHGLLAVGHATTDHVGAA